MIERREVGVWSVALVVTILAYVSTPAECQSVPDCPRPRILVTKVENSISANTVITTFACTDPGTVSYSIDTGNALNHFKIPPTTNELIMSIVPDAEQKNAGIYTSPFVLMIKVLDNETIPLAAYVTVIVQITSLNDNSPVFSAAGAFSSLPTTITVNENTAVGTVIYQCGATDGDNTNYFNQYTVTNELIGTNPNFALDPKTCELTLIKALDFETTPSYTLDFHAFDQVSPPGEDTQALTINVAGVNDNDPTCGAVVFWAQVNDGDATGTPVKTLACTDPDGTTPTLSITGGATTRFQLVGSEVQLLTGVDSEAADTTLLVEITVNDAGTPQRSTTVTIGVYVLDIDDNIPTMSVTALAASVSEDAIIGTSVTTVTATDADVTAEPKRITYVLNPAPCSPDWFTINPISGELLVNATMTASTVTCSVSAYSSNNAGSTATPVTVTITVTPVNTAPPVFTSQLYTLSTAPRLENSATGVVALSPGAISATGSTAVTYALGSVTTPFSIDFTSGSFSQTGLLNYEVATSYLIPVLAMDAGTPALTATSYIYIEVGPVNDFPPTFTAIPNTDIPEDTYPGTSILQATATDGDAGVDGVLTYTLRDINVPFVIDPDTGIFRVGFDLNREVQALYTIIVEAEDNSSTTPLTGSTTFTITLTDVDDNSPTCASVGEPVITPAISLGTDVATMSCTDVDSSGTVVTYSKTNGDPNNYFTVNPSTGGIRQVKVSPAGSYSFDVIAHDGGGVTGLDTVVPVTIKVEVALSFTNLPKILSVPENTALGAILDTIVATGSYDAITYTIQSGNGAGMFHLHQSSGVLRLLKTLDRETTAYYKLVIRAASVNSNFLDSALDIAVSDINDNTPIFPASFYEYTVAESATVPTTIQATLTATDADTGANAAITYSILSGNGEGKFTYDASGNLILSTGLNYEVTKSYVLKLAATDNGFPALTGTTNVFINVTAVDEFPPTIVSTGGTVTESVSENAAIGSALFLVTASDGDFGSELIWTITSGNTDGKFAFNDTSGEMYLVTALDRETTPSYTLGIQVINNLGQTDTATLHITVTDYNDNDPTFSLGNYVFNVADSTASGTTVGTLTVTDQDAPPNDVYTLSILSGNTAGRFTVTGDNIVTAATILYSDATVYGLVVQALDGGTPARSSTATVSIVVTAPYKLPLFNPTSASVNQLENIVTGTYVYDCDATAAGATEGFTGDLVYTIVSGDTTSHFYVEPYTGQIQLLKVLDYDVTTSYTLFVRAANRNLLTLTSTLTLTINVVQVNLDPPSFVDTVYNFTVSEAVAIGTNVGTPISATDTDLGAFGTVTYTIETNTALAVDATSGQITTISALEHATAPAYMLKVFGTDNAGGSSLTGTSIVIVTVTDTNTHTPFFVNSPYTLYIPETVTVGTTIRILKATDLDSGTFATLTYAVAAAGNEEGKFAVGTSTGLLTLAAALDYEITTQYVITVEASDGGTPSLTGTATVTIHVLDRNDYVPVFSATSYEAVVVASTPALSSVTTVAATDQDQGDAGLVAYLIENGNTAGYFNIDPTTGEIKTAKTLPTAGGYFPLTVIAVDKGTPPLTGTTTVGIAVADITSPGSADYAFTVEENLDAGTVVGTIPGDPAFTETGYAITAGNYAGHFAISNTGVITTTAPLDRETYSVYQMTVTVTHTTGTYTKTVLVSVTDVNDNACIFHPADQTIHIVEMTPIGTTVATFNSITDADTGTNAAATSFISMPYYNLFFAADSSTGAVTLLRLIDYETFARTAFRIFVACTDAGNPPLRGSATVTVSLIDFTETINYLPIEPGYLVNHYIPYDLAAGSIAYTLTPSDFGLNFTAGDTVSYDAPSDSGTVFTVDESLGTMTINANTMKFYPLSRYIQWVTCTVTTAAGVVEARVSVVRFDVFSRNDHMVSVVTGLSVADLETNRTTLQTRLSAKLTSPNAARISEVAATALTTRRRLLAVESVAHTVGIANSGLENLNSIDQMQTFLTQAQMTAALQSNADGTPASGISDGTIPVTIIAPYDDGSRSDSTQVDDPEMIAAIVAGCVASLLLIAGTIAVIIYCCRTTRMNPIIKYPTVPEMNHNNIFDADHPADGDGLPSTPSRPPETTRAIHLTSMEDRM